MSSQTFIKSFYQLLTT